jgi:hypothetical protein
VDHAAATTEVPVQAVAQVVACMPMHVMKRPMTKFVLAVKTSVMTVAAPTQGKVSE